jgi:hypothetical protein
VCWVNDRLGRPCQHILAKWKFDVMKNRFNDKDVPASCHKKYTRKAAMAANLIADQLLVPAAPELQLQLPTSSGSAAHADVIHLKKQV